MLSLRPLGVDPAKLSSPVAELKVPTLQCWALFGVRAVAQYVQQQNIMLCCIASNT
jgi:hypothetical protein